MIVEPESLFTIDIPYSNYFYIFIIYGWIVFLLLIN